MKRFKNIFAVITGLVCMSSVFTAIGCGGEKGNTDGTQHEHTYETGWSYDQTNHWHKATCEHTSEKSGTAEHNFNGNKCTVCGYQKTVQYSVTFNLNYSGATNAEPVKVESGAKVSKPTDPQQTGFIFSGWYTEAEGGELYDFNTAVTGNITLYAHWIAEGATLRTVSFNLNYEGAPAATEVKVEDGKKVSSINAEKAQKISSDDNKYSYDFVNEKFEGWYTNPECTVKYDFDSAVNADITLYAKWGATTYTFEAELTNLTGKTGYGYSISYDDEELIRYDSAERNQSASMGYSVGYLYAEDLSIEFEIYAEEAVSNVTLTARLSSEFRDVFIAPSQTTIGGNKYCDFWFLVNDTELDYEPIALTGAQITGAINQRPFTDHLISTKVSLKKGKNVIQLYVANSEFFESTVTAMAPMVDCLYLTTDATLSWEPVWGNLDKVLTDVV